MGSKGAEMEPAPVSLKELDRVEVLTLIDNFVDVLLEDTEIVTRPPKAVGEEIPTDALYRPQGHGAVFPGVSILICAQQRRI